MYFQLSVRVKVRLTVYVALSSASVPLAKVWGEVESLTGAPQEPLPLPPTVALLQVTVTAETGTVRHPGKLALGACTVRDQEAGMTPIAFQVTEAAVFPGSAGESGSVAWKLMELGVAVIPLSETTS
jgi:hypothetical protein